DGPKATFSFSAVFAEVHVDPEFGLVRLNRFVGAYDCGRIINPKTARSQAIGGIIWGVGQALLEKSETDPVMGRFLNRNYSGYLVPTSADIPELDVLFVGDFDEEASPIGVKGLGELTSVSVAPAIANAVYHATGKRIRHFRRWPPVASPFYASAEATFSIDGRLRTERRGCAKIWGLPRDRRIGGTRAFCDRPCWHHSVELLLANRDQPRRRWDYRSAR